MKVVLFLLILTGLLITATCSIGMEDAYIPGIKVALEVRAPDGNLRSFHRPGAQPTYWAQDMPVVKGDTVTIVPMITTGGADLKEVRIRLDSTELSRKAEGPWRLAVATAKLAEGYHMVEVWASAKAKDTKENTATATFLVVPKNDPLLQILEPTTTAETGPPVVNEERLSCVIRSRDPATDKDLTATATASVTGPTHFFVAGQKGAKEFFYTLTRDGRVTYTSARLPMLTDILLVPKKADGSGQMAGEVILTARVGDGSGSFGAPTWVTIHIAEGRAQEE